MIHTIENDYLKVSVNDHGAELYSIFDKIHNREVIWQVAARRSTYKMLDKRSALYKAKRKIEKAKAQVRAKVEPPFRVIKRQFGYTKVRFRGLVRNTAQLVTLFALSNLWMARRHLLASAGEVRL